MKATSLVTMLCICMMCFTGFGNTTTDLTENSTTDIVQMDTSVTVAMINVDSPENYQDVEQQNLPGFDQPNSKYLEASITAAIKTDAQLANRFKDLFAIADNELFSKQDRYLLNKLLDVGWQTNKQDYNSSTNLNLPYQDNDLSTSQSLKDPGGVLLLFYGIDRFEI